MGDEIPKQLMRSGSQFLNKLMSNYFKKCVKMHRRNLETH